MSSDPDEFMHVNRTDFIMDSDGSEDAAWHRLKIAAMLIDDQDGGLPESYPAFPPYPGLAKPSPKRPSRNVAEKRRLFRQKQNRHVNVGVNSLNSVYVNPSVVYTDQSYADHSAGYAESNEGYAEPNEDYAEPIAGYVEPNMGYAEPIADYAEPNAGYAKPNAGYAEPNATYSSGRALPSKNTPTVPDVSVVDFSDDPSSENSGSRSFSSGHDTSEPNLPANFSSSLERLSINYGSSLGHDSYSTHEPSHVLGNVMSTPQVLDVPDTDAPSPLFLNKTPGTPSSMYISAVPQQWDSTCDSGEGVAFDTAHPDSAYISEVTSRDMLSREYDHDSNSMSLTSAEVSPNKGDANEHDARPELTKGQNTQPPNTSQNDKTGHADKSLVSEPSSYTGKSRRSRKTRHSLKPRQPSTPSPRSSKLSQYSQYIQQPTSDNSVSFGSSPDASLDMSFDASADVSSSTPFDTGVDTSAAQQHAVSRIVFAPRPDRLSSHGMPRPHSSASAMPPVPRTASPQNRSRSALGNRVALTSFDERGMSIGAPSFATDTSYLKAYNDPDKSRGSDLHMDTIHGTAFVREALKGLVWKKQLNCHFESSRGFRVSYSDIGVQEGKPILVFLGLQVTRHVMEIYRDLAEAYRLRIITVDRWGIGGSSQYVAVPEDRHMFETWAHVVAELMGCLDLPGVSIVAHSAGAPFALALAHMFPQRIFGNIHLLAPWLSLHGADLLNSRYKVLKYVPASLIRGSTSKPGDRTRSASVDHRAIKQLRRLSAANREQLRMPFDNVKVDHDMSLTEALIVFSMSSAAKGGRAELAHLLDRAAWHNTENLAQVQTPITVWQGSRDDKISVSAVKRLEHVFSNCKVRIIPDAGHNLMTNFGVMLAVFDDLKEG